MSQWARKRLLQPHPSQCTCSAPASPQASHPHGTPTSEWHRGIYPGHRGLWGSRAGTVRGNSPNKRLNFKGAPHPPICWTSGQGSLLCLLGAVTDPACGFGRQSVRGLMGQCV